MTEAVGTQFTGTLNAGETRRWYTFNWPFNWFVVWSIRPTTNSAKVELVRVEVERFPGGFTYFLTIRNNGTTPVTFEGKYNGTTF